MFTIPSKSTISVLENELYNAGVDAYDVSREALENLIIDYGFDFNMSVMNHEVALVTANDVDFTEAFRLTDTRTLPDLLDHLTTLYQISFVSLAEDSIVSSGW